MIAEVARCASSNYVQALSSCAPGGRRVWTSVNVGSKSSAAWRAHGDAASKLDRRNTVQHEGFIAAALAGLLDKVVAGLNDPGPRCQDSIRRVLAQATVPF